MKTYLKHLFIEMYYSNLNGLIYATEQDESVKEKYRKDFENIVTNWYLKPILGK
ncbi:hypothetical protein HYD66_00870 [Mycoplasmopsis bovis]|nr:hypothetical protein [Mycoplasmopsis bovis]QQH55017.1 hypothetical protein HYD66_00870 [Mycoplasmopsis bovis]